MSATNKMQIEYWDIDRLIPYARNPRKNDDAVPKMAGVIKEFGFKVPIVAKSDGEVIDGHLRLKAARQLGMAEVPVVLADEWTPAQVKAFRLAVNRSAEWAEWDDELLKLELDDLKLEDFDLDLIGFEDIQLEDAPAEGLTDPDEVPEVQEKAVTQTGDIWILGRHRLMCGDSTDAGSVALLMNGEKADMVFTDPPYGMGKQAVGVLNDNQNKDELIEFNARWIPVSFDALKDKGSWYCWGTDEGLLDIYAVHLLPLIRAGRCALKNFLAWEKPNVVGLNPGDRMYHTATEKCLFVMFGREELTGFRINSDAFSPKMQPLLDYMEGEADRLGLTPKTCAEITGTASMYQHWFSTSQFCIPTRENYEKLQLAFASSDGFKREYDGLKREYDGLKREFYEGRAYFDNGAEDAMTDVWHFTSPSAKERESCGGHATPKPVALCERAVKVSAPGGGSVLDLFGGSGSTLIACEKTGRVCRMMELSPHYCDVIVRRWQDFTGKEATLESSGKPFAQVAQERGA